MPKAAKKPAANSLMEEWVTDENLILLEGWARDGLTYNDIAQRIGINTTTLQQWRKKAPEIDEALKNGREVVDYKVENALLRAALGYTRKEVKVTTIMRYGKVVETQKEELTTDQAPNVQAATLWLCNRLPDKWKKNRDNKLLDGVDEDTSIKIEVTRQSKPYSQEQSTVDEDPWEDTNESVTVRRATKSEKAEADKKKAVEKQQKAASDKGVSITVIKNDSEDLDYWPEDWTDEDEDQ